MSNRTKAIIQMNLFCITCIFYQACAKKATATIHVMDLCLARTLINLLFSIVILNISGKNVIKDVPRQAFPLIILRSTTGLIGFTTLVYSIEILPLFIFQIIYNTSPFWTGILAYIFVKEDISKIQIFCMFGCFVGVVFLSVSKSNLFKQEDVNNKFVFGLLMVFITAWAHSAQAVITRKLKEVHFSLMMFYYGSFATSILFIYVVLEYLI